MVAGRYQIESYLNQGGMGTVYRGRDTQTGKMVAVKQLKPDIVLSDAGLITRFEREGQALAKLDHPNIVKLLASEQHEASHFLVLEYVSGGSLADLLTKDRRLPVERVMRIGIELADALTRAHYLKIVHRDLKPANVLLDEDGTPRLTDFGVAHFADSNVTGTGMIIGTFAYVPPEMLNGETIDPRADIWSLGVLLFEMLAGQRPFEGESTGAQMAAILTKPVPDLETLRSDAPIGLVDLIYRMLDKDRNHRISSMRIVGAELEAIQAGRSLAAPPTPRPVDVVTPAIARPTATPTPTKPAHNLPAQTTPFVGREDELAELKKLLNDPGMRLITLQGPGGMGKTRLAIEAASRTDHFALGAHFVALAPLTDPNNIPTAIADTLKFQFTRGAEDPIQQLCDYLQEKSILLILDNFEHVTAGSGVVDQLLHSAPNLKILVTSRERLNLQSETIYRIEGMDFPDWKTPAEAMQYSAAQLFVQSAKRAQPDFSLKPDEVRYVAQICRQVQGMPLGIVLAASWVEMLSLREIAAEIEKSVDFLETEQRDIPTRQRSIRAVFDYSWNLMSMEERIAFKKLAIFRGGFTREAAQEVTSASLRTLMTLVNKSLVRRNANGRYEIHEMLRQYAEDKLKEHVDPYNEAQTAHARYYLRFLDIKFKKEMLSTANQASAVLMMREETENLLRAWDWAVDQGNAELVSNAVQGLFMYCYIGERYTAGEKAFTKGREKFRPVPNQAMEMGQGTVYGFCLGMAAFFRTCNGHHDHNAEDFNAAEAIIRECGESVEFGYFLAVRGMLAATMNDMLGLNYHQVEAKILEAIEIFKREGDRYGQGLAYFLLSMAERYTGNLMLSEQHARLAQQIAEELHAPDLAVYGALAMAGVAWTKGDYLFARDQFEKCINNGSMVTAGDMVAHLEINLCLICAPLGEFDRALNYANTARKRFLDRGQASGLIRATSAAGWVYEAMGNYTQMNKQFAEATGLARKHGNPAWLAIELANLTRSEVRLGQYNNAYRSAQEALKIALETNSNLEVFITFMWLAYTRAKLATPEAQPHEIERAVEIINFILQQPNSMETVRDAEAILSEFVLELPSDRYAAALERGKNRNFESILSELA
jgi:predicted ATPase